MAASEQAGRAVYDSLRAALLAQGPESLPDPFGTVLNIFGVLMEYRLEDDLISLWCGASGDTSLIVSQGAVVRGGITHPEIAAKARDFVLIAELFFDVMSPASEFPSPEPGRIVFYALTRDGVVTADVPENSAEYAELIVAGHEILGDISDTQLTGA